MCVCVCKKNREEKYVEMIDQTKVKTGRHITIYARNASNVPCVNDFAENEGDAEQAMCKQQF